jgi:hypothetical protein
MPAAVPEIEPESAFPNELLDIPRRTDILVPTTARLDLTRIPAALGTFLIDLRAQL